MIYTDTNGNDVIINDLFDVAEIARKNWNPALAKFIKTQAMELIDLRAWNSALKQLKENLQNSEHYLQDQNLQLSEELYSLLDNIQFCCHCKRKSDDSDDGK